MKIIAFKKRTFEMIGESGTDGAFSTSGNTHDNYYRRR
jgi:hypothetical protein